MTPALVKLAVLTASLSVLTACADGFSLPGTGAGASETAQDSAGDGATTRLVERDVESPEVFQRSEDGLWDGRPSLGGVWVAHPDVTDPERVIIRNQANQKFVIGALFRRERDNPGPRFQVSSDAAEALGLLAGQPVEVNVTALRREEVDQAPAAPGPAATAIEEPETIEALSLDTPTPEAAAIGAEATAAITPTAAPTPPRAPVSTLSRPFIQIGIFSVETNANDTATALRGAGMIPTVREQTTAGKQFFRVMVGPATTRSEQNALLVKVQELGFADAYFTDN